MYRNILHATDLNESHFQVCEKAVKIAKLLNAKLYLLHVIDIPTGVQLAQSLGFTEVAAPSSDDAWTVMNLLGEALNIPQKNQFIDIGHTREAIEKKIEELNCDLLILGSHDSEKISGLTGSVGSGIMLHPPCDVMTLRGF